MGGITMARTDFVDRFVEIVGYKAGIVITAEDLAKLLTDFDEALAAKLKPNGPEGFRLHSTEFEEIVAHLLFKLGNIDSPSTMSASATLFHEAKDDPAALERWHSVMEDYNGFMKSVLIDPPPDGTRINPGPFMVSVARKHGKTGLDMALALIKGANRHMHISPWGSVRTVEWKDELELKELFQSEKLETLHGSFFDQRFIDYLNKNFGEIGNIHWRKFEALAGEYFNREGFKVDMGPGRNDDGIDLRIYPRDHDEASPPLIIVQCKRQKAKIGKALIKSVYADVEHESAKSGLIVTSSYISPGAATLRTARGYPVEAADRDTLRTWINKMKSDQVG